MKKVIGYNIVVLIIASMISLFWGCSKLGDSVDNFFSPFSSPESKLARDWNVNSVSKDGIIIHSISVSPICGMGRYNPPVDLYFYGNGEVTDYCSIGGSGIWQLTGRKKNIQITLINSSITSVINWKILKLEAQTLQVQETRRDGVYEFIFRLNHDISP